MAAAKIRAHGVVTLDVTGSAIVASWWEKCHHPHFSDLLLMTEFKNKTDLYILWKTKLYQTLTVPPKASRGIRGATVISNSNQSGTLSNHTTSFASLKADFTG